MGKEEADREQDQEGAKQREGAEHEAQRGPEGNKLATPASAAADRPFFFSWPRNGAAR